MGGPLVLVSGATKEVARRLAAAEEDAEPRADYFEIARRLNGEVLGYDLSDGWWYRKVRGFEKRLKLDFVEAFVAVRRASRHNMMISLSEKIAIPLAVLFQLTRWRMPHVVVGHKLSSGLKVKLLQRWPLHHTFSHLVMLSETQAEFAIHQLHMPSSRTSWVLNPVDHRFFRPLEAAHEDYILTVGNEQRDYATLGKALAGTGIKLVVVASSQWASGSTAISQQAEVQVMPRLSYRELRDCYARARLVVIPLYDVDYAAGVNALQEAMAVGKPVIISRTPGIADYVVENETGVYAPPGNSEALRSAILSLWENAPERARLGANARQAVEDTMNLDLYVDHIENIVRQTPH